VRRAHGALRGVFGDQFPFIETYKQTRSQHDSLFTLNTLLSYQTTAYSIPTTATMLPTTPGIKVLLAILTILASDIGVSYNGIGRHSNELQTCFYGAASFSTTTNVDTAVMTRLIGTNADTNRFTDEASQQIISLITNLMANLSPASQQWLYVAFSQGKQCHCLAQVLRHVFSPNFVFFACRGLHVPRTTRVIRPPPRKQQSVHPPALTYSKPFYLGGNQPIPISPCHHFLLWLE